ncbi:MAG TPA: hypothetical protein VFM53_05730 [Anaeromyxobacteraceae bacterium]|nr:hypothetical protein [Anaeromyxobacteraceae bacterium]
MRRLASTAVLLLLAGCATGAAVADRTRVAPVLAPGVSGGIAWYRNDGVLMKEAIWGDGRIAAGPRGGPAYAGLTRQPDGTWQGGGEYNQTIVLRVAPGRITGPSVNVTVTPVEGGFRIFGLWMGRNADLVVDARGARAQQIQFTRQPDGAYVSGDLPNMYIFLVGEAARLDAPPWPELALTALTGGWGVQ